MGSPGLRRDSKHRVLRRGESIRQNGKYQFKYIVDGKPVFLYSWRLEPTDPQPVGKKPCMSLRELEKLARQDIESQLDPFAKNMTVNELVDRYLSTKTGVKPNTLAGYNFVKNLLEKEEFGRRKIRMVKTSDAKLFLVKLQQDGKGCSTIKTIRGVLRPAFQMAVDDDILNKNPFGFELANVIVNDSQKREALTQKQMEKFLKFCHNDNIYYMRVSSIRYFLSSLDSVFTFDLSVKFIESLLYFRYIFLKYTMIMYRWLVKKRK